MDLVLANGFCELTEEEALFIDGGWLKAFISVAVAVAVVAAVVAVTIVTCGVGTTAIAAGFLCGGMLGTGALLGTYGLLDTYTELS